MNRRLEWAFIYWLIFLLLYSLSMSSTCLLTLDIFIFPDPLGNFSQFVKWMIINWWSIILTTGSKGVFFIARNWCSVERCGQNLFLFFLCFYFFLSFFPRKVYPANTVVHHQIGRGPHAPSLTPFALKLETYLRMAKVPFMVHVNYLLRFHSF